ncbi:MAG: T9SS type B sorting domain-containing protein, partial [Gelidibacter sp.]|nr:T9SS type B sorting domain-containing protein [Gelidibacter sp.]
GEGDYEYAIDNVNGPYQDSNTFDNVSPGLHTVYVRDKNDCGVVDELVSVIGFPKYFTPNDDTYHDYWQVYGITPEFQSQTSIFIFDRHGKLLKELDPLSAGWDGTLNGYTLPATDYWFAVTLEDGRVFKSHFTLKR